MRIALLGDMAFYGRYSVTHGQSTFDYFMGVAEYLSGFDHVVGNLETPLCEDGKPKGQKSAYISASTDSVALMNYLGITVVNLANNHIFDYGKSGYCQTVAALNKAGIQYFGVDGKEVELVDTSAQVALHGYCSFNTNPLGVGMQFGSGLNCLNVERVSEKIIERDKNNFLNIISIHSGQEHVNYPSRDDIQMARLFAELCPYVYYGHHPHVMQGFENCNDSLIAYSLGNFCFDDVYTNKSPEPLVRQTENNKTGLIVEIEVEGKSVRDYRIRPIFMGSKALILDPTGAVDKLRLYCEALQDNTQEYESRRVSLISGLLSERRNMRDLEWYMKRMNLNSVGVLLRGKYNQYQYRRNVSCYLS